jgi:hypothetical protein
VRTSYASLDLDTTNLPSEQASARGWWDLEENMSSRTAFLSKLIGIYCIVVSLAMLAHKQATVEMVIALVHDAPLLFLTGFIALTAGLAMVLCHNVWSGGAAPVIVTLIGWASLVKGALILFLPPAAEADVFLGGLYYARLFYLYAAFSLLIGIYLTYAGAKSTAH